MRTGNVITTSFRSDAPSLLARVLAAFSAGVLIFLGFGVGIILLFKIIYLGQVYPGVQVSGIDLSGVRKSDLDNFLAEQITFPETGLIVFEDSGKNWVCTLIKKQPRMPSTKRAEKAGLGNSGGNDS